jgi:hypothetical protein
MVVARAGADQAQLSTKFETRDDPAIIRGYGNLLIQVWNLGRANSFR